MLKKKKKLNVKNSGDSSMLHRHERHTKYKTYVMWVVELNIYKVLFSRNNDTAFNIINARH